MKVKHLLFLFTILAIGITSCSKKDSQPDSVKIVGTWNLKSTHLTSLMSGSGYNFTIDTTMLPKGGDYLKITFNTDNTLSIEESSEGEKSTGIGTYALNGGKISISSSDNNSIEYPLGGLSGGLSGTGIKYRIKGNFLILTFSESNTNNDVTMQMTTEIKFQKEK